MGDDTPAEFYLHIRVLISLVLGLGLTRLLTGLSRFIQHPERLKVYPVHLVWVATVVLTIMNFWWWEFALIRLDWNFALFAFVLFYAFLFFLLACLLFPEDMSDYAGFEDYFFLAQAVVLRPARADAGCRFRRHHGQGAGHLAALGIEYKIRLPLAILACLVAARTASRRFHVAFAAIYLAYTVSWIVRVYWRMG